VRGRLGSFSQIQTCDDGVDRIFLRPTPFHFQIRVRGNDVVDLRLSQIAVVGRKLAKRNATLQFYFLALALGDLDINDFEVNVAGPEIEQERVTNFGVA
jgi:hypothetical protein